MQPPRIDIRDIRKEYRSGDVVTSILHGVSFHVNAGEFIAIMGPSGSGKSTLMHILSFLDTPTSGAYLFNGTAVEKKTDDELAKIRNESVGFVFQSFNLLPRTTVAENVRLPLIYSSQTNIDPKVRDAVEAVGLSHRINHTSNQLSGGEKQRVAIARALVNNPDVIFADEPTGNLDSVSGNQILRILQSLNDAGRTIIMVTHELDTAKHAKRIIQIRDGIIVSDTTNTDQRSARDEALKK